MAVVSRVENRLTILALKLAGIANFCFLVGDLLEVTKHLTNNICDHVEVELTILNAAIVGQDSKANVEVRREAEVAGIFSDRTTFSQGVYDGANVFSSPINFPGTTDPVAKIGGVRHRVKPAASNGRGKKIGGEDRVAGSSEILHGADKREGTRRY
ncbi:hypothetical protein HG530_006711 [Fusarium avenaceum]|nr:hypothetical protein HG530_006711 [Fusarium avenaceum]